MTDPSFRQLHALFTLVAFAWVATFAVLAWRRRRRHPPFPPRESVTVLFEERWTSGRSLRSWVTRIGGAGRCLRVTVTPDELWVALHMPFALLAGCDLEHRIPRTNIRSVRRGRGRVTVEFVANGPSANPATLELYLLDPEGFMHALGYAQGFEVVT